MSIEPAKCDRLFIKASRCAGQRARDLPAALLHSGARQFKQSIGIAPHHYLTQKWVERAQEMLAKTDLSLSEIAYAAGFSDQSHLARHFRHMLGKSRLPLPLS
jgi:methylphosphotriester-DNA--protein-cysteine methyltransferase